MERSEEYEQEPVDGRRSASVHSARHIEATHMRSTKTVLVDLARRGSVRVDDRWPSRRSPVAAVVEYAGGYGAEKLSATRRVAELEWRRICERRLE